MWGCISTEASYQFNFNLGFSTTRSDVLVHLSQWQYWWWFWFSLVWTFYYLIVSRVVRFRVLKMRPKIVTSYRPHGKWGDFLACIVPMIWCINILTNSNFILRLIEWQNESSLFTVRVRAKQWYWIYKFELKNFTDILTAPKNIGRNKWIFSTFGDLQVANDYLHLLQLRSQNKWVKKYWNDILKQSGKVNQNNIVSPQEQFRSNLLNLNFYNNLLLNFNEKKNLITIKNNTIDLFSKNTSIKINTINNTFLLNSNLNYLSNCFKKSKFFEYKDLNDFNSFFFLNNSNSFFFFDNLFSFRNKKEVLNYFNINFFLLKNNDFNSLKLNNYQTSRYFSDLPESTRWVKKSQGSIKPLRFIKLPLLIDDKVLEDSIFKNDFSLFRVRFNLDNQKLFNKNYSDNPYLTLKQKKYSRVANIKPVNRVLKQEENGVEKKIRYSAKPVLINNNIFEENLLDSKIQYRMIKKSKVRDDIIPVTLARRILRTKKTLVIPAHTNITLITNSYDIVHSWFIPGLGIKLDCVPGRSTHHTFYIDNVGFYYGQCAEICGRYHHHMPIRVCALPFEHFLTWWHTFGLTKLIFTNNQKRYNNYYSFRKFVW